MRKETEITIEEGRDKGKEFKITEMPATQADRWVTKTLCLFGHSGQSFNVLAKMPLSGILDAFSKVDYEKAEPLLNELLACASFKKDGIFVAMKGSMVDSVVEDWTTIFRLRIEALKLVVGFLEQGGESESK